MTVLLIGGSGFIGSELARQLTAKQLDFAIADIRPSQIFPKHCQIADVTSEEALDSLSTIGAQAIFLLAAEHRDDVQPRSRYALVNVEGARNVAKFAEKQGIQKIVFTSSVAVYGFADPETGENGEINPFNDYGRTKAEAERVLLDWQAGDAENRSLTIVRPTVVFGPGNRGNVYNLLKQIAQRRFVMIGNGLNRKSMAYVENVAAFLAFALDFGPGIHKYNYIDKPDFDVNTLVAQVNDILHNKKEVGLRLPIGLGIIIGHIADVVAKVTGRSLPVSAIRVQKFVKETSFSSRVHDLPGFVAPVSIKEGLRRTLDSEFINPDPNRILHFTE